jgi:phosphopantetheine--protein transferase-like protein
MISVGVDQVSVERFQFINTAGGRAFFYRVFTFKEQQACNCSLTLLATCFAAKEVVSKVLKTGLAIGAIDQVICQEIEILNIEMSQPTVCISGFAKQVSDQLNFDQILLQSAIINNYIIVWGIGAGGIPFVDLQQILIAAHTRLKLTPKILCRGKPQVCKEILFF